MKMSIFKILLLIYSPSQLQNVFGWIFLLLSAITIKKIIIMSANECMLRINIQSWINVCNCQCKTPEKFSEMSVIVNVKRQRNSVAKRSGNPVFIQSNFGSERSLSNQVAFCWTRAKSVRGTSPPSAKLPITQIPFEMTGFYTQNVVKHLWMHLYYRDKDSLLGVECLSLPDNNIVKSSIFVSPFLQYINAASLYESKHNNNVRFLVEE